MTEEIRKDIFEPFFTTKSKAEGTGLGLWITQGIVQSHGGTIEVISQCGKGTSFTVSLPIV
jgi:signal transduction histidine kinase